MSSPALPEPGQAAVNVHWYLLPLIATVSLVYAGTRHENLRAIWNHARSLFLYVCACLLLVFAVLFGLHLWI